MYDLAHAMMNGVEIKDRKALLKSYSQCFLGKCSQTEMIL